jgi:hypothetical protein
LALGHNTGLTTREQEANLKKDNTDMREEDVEEDQSETDLETRQMEWAK